MSAAVAIKKPPRRPQRPVERLDSIKNPQPRPPPRQIRPQSQQCPNPDCNQKESVEEDGKLICSACGSVIDELTMVSEVTYGLTAGGHHIVHGYHVGADQAFARRGDVVDRTRAASSQEVTAQFGKLNAQICSAYQLIYRLGHNHIVRIGSLLHMNGQIKDHAMQIFKLAIGPGGFIQGRRIKSVAAVALYIACRVQTHPNTFMLIDFSDILAVSIAYPFFLRSVLALIHAKLNVFDLGQVYTKFLQYLALNGNGYIVQPINPEDLILRFAQRLEFGNETMRVANDAVRIVQRMNRDWMTPGRRPAGVCGAALILAARMNNFRRSVREVVFVVKVQEQTIFNRLDEFRATESSGLTVEEFRTIDLERAADPPAFTQDRNGKKRGRKRKQIDANFGDDGDGVEPTVISSRATSTCPSEANSQLSTSANIQTQAQIDRQSMPPPPLPVDPSLLELSSQPASETHQSPSSGSEYPSVEGRPAQSSHATATEPPTKRRRGRPPGAKNLKTPPATQPYDESSYNISDPPLESDITAALTDPTNFDHVTALTSSLESEFNPSSPPPTQQDLPLQPHLPIPDTETISDSEFADDPEVYNCLLTPSEVVIKTRIWTHENREYLRAQAAKILKQQLAEEHGTARVITRRKRRRKRIGDMSQYLDEDGQEGMPIAGSPEEAVMKMMGKRAFSKKINYGSIVNAYGGSSSSTSRRGSDAILAGSPGSGVEMSGALQVASPGRRGGDADGKNAAAGNHGDDIEHNDEDGEEAHSVAGTAEPEQQKALNSIAGELEEEGINESSDDAADDDDPYGNEEGETIYDSD